MIRNFGRTPSILGVLLGVLAVKEKRAPRGPRGEGDGISIPSPRSVQFEVDPRGVGLGVRGRADALLELDEGKYALVEGKVGGLGVLERALDQWAPRLSEARARGVRLWVILTQSAFPIAGKEIAPWARAFPVAGADPVELVIGVSLGAAGVLKGDRKEARGSLLKILKEAQEALGDRNVLQVAALLWAAILEDTYGSSFKGDPRAAPRAEVEEEGHAKLVSLWWGRKPRQFLQLAWGDLPEVKPSARFPGLQFKVESRDLEDFLRLTAEEVLNSLHAGWLAQVRHA